MSPSTTPDARAFGQALLVEAERRLLGESLPRIKSCLERLSEEEIWRRPNDSLVSIGNLVLHLCGNARQWIVTALGGEADHRVRSAEFAERGPLPTGELVARLETTLADVQATLRRLDPASLLEQRPVQTYMESGLSIIVHVVEHFSYHTGQISWATKLMRDTDLGYYRGVDLSRKGGPPPA